jgi:hypothetical protein
MKCFIYSSLKSSRECLENNDTPSSIIVEGNRKSNNGEDDDKRDSLALVPTENNGEVNEGRLNVREGQPEVIDMLDDDTVTDDDESIEVISAHGGEDSDCSDLYK